MEMFTILIVIGIIYAVLYFFDFFFKSCMHYPYTAFLKGTGLNVKFLRIQFYTTAFNRTIVKWSSSSPRFLSHFFDLGVYFSIISLPIVFVFLIVCTINSNNSSNATSSKIESVKLELMLPGVNLPTNELGYYVLVLGISSVLHELGHAIAAVLEDVPLIGFGLHIMLIVPVAYTETGTEQFNALKMWKKLRVLCAGIWHNVILALLGYLCFLSLPFILTPLYTLNSSVIIINHKINSPIYGPKGLDVGDVITNINNCKVMNINSWYGCLLETIHHQPAYCVSSDFLHSNDETIIPITHIKDGIIECCDPQNSHTSCFEYVADTYDGEIEVPQHMCLNIRETIEHSLDYCNKNVKCNTGFCVKPIINNLTTIIHVKREEKNDMIYMGHPADISFNVKVSEYVPKFSLLSSSLGDNLSLFFKYLVVFSFGLAVVNIIPCFGLDGQHILSTLLNQILIKRIKKKNKRELVSLCITVLGTLLFFINLVKAVWISLVNKLN